VPPVSVSVDVPNTMNKPFVLLLLLVSAVNAAGCAAIHHLDDYTTGGGGAGGPSSKDDPKMTPPGGSDTTTPATTCTTHRACTDAATAAAGGIATPAVCVKASGKCASLVTAECSRVHGDPSNENAILLGTLFGSDPVSATSERAAVLAAEEINTADGAKGLPPTTTSGEVRPIVIVACDAQGGALQATRHLVDDLHVPAIIGPAAGEDVVAATQQVSAKGGTLLMTEAVASSVTNLADEGLTWRLVPSDSQRAKLVIQQINALEDLLRATRSLTSVKLGIVHPANALGESAREAIRGKLILNGRFITDPANAANVSLDTYPPGDMAAARNIATRYAATFKPDIVFVASKDEVTGVIVPLEQALTVARVLNRPYYLATDAAKTDDFLSALAAPDMPADIKRRVRGVGVRPDASSATVLSDFVTAFTRRHGVAPGPPSSQTTASAAAAYDATYAIAYAIAATPHLPLFGPSVAQGLRSLAIGDAFTVGPSSVEAVVRALEANRSVALRGTFSSMQWDLTGDMSTGSVEVWCIGSLSGRPVFGSSGLTMDVANQVIGGAFVQCQ
jgi:ABC-type branched-subunit amino acid transport system substrate-binding protein